MKWAYLLNIPLNSILWPFLVCLSYSICQTMCTLIHFKRWITFVESFHSDIFILFYLSSSNQPINFSLLVIIFWAANYVEFHRVMVAIGNFQLHISKILSEATVLQLVRVQNKFNSSNSDLYIFLYDKLKILLQSALANKLNVWAEQIMWSGK